MTLKWFLLGVIATTLLFTSWRMFIAAAIALPLVYTWARLWRWVRKHGES